MALGLLIGKKRERKMRKMKQKLREGVVYSFVTFLFDLIKSYFLILEVTIIFTTIFFYILINDAMKFKIILTMIYCL